MMELILANQTLNAGCPDFGVKVGAQLPCNNTPDSRHFPALAQCIPELAHLHVSSRIIAFYCASLHFIVHLHILTHLRVSPHIFTFHRASSHSIAHLRVPSRIFVFHRDLVRIIAGASIHCPASSLVRRIPFITISVYVWHHTIIISLWTLTLHHLHT
jgi:hypothetical protein